jgi:hypothetical protein
MKIRARDRQFTFSFLMGEGASMMADDPKAKRNPYADIAPALGDYTERVLFGEVWERPELSKRDRSLIIVATLVALYRTNELPSQSVRGTRLLHDRGQGSLAHGLRERSRRGCPHVGVC